MTEEFGRVAGKFSERHFRCFYGLFRGLPCDHYHTFMVIIKMSYLRRRNVIYLTPKPNCFKNIYLNNKAIQLMAFPISI